MQDPKPKQATTFSVGWRWPVTISILVMILGFAFAATPARMALERDVARRLEFKVRSLLGHAPKLDSRIKILAWDDKTIALLDGWKALTVNDLPLLSWSRLFQSIAKENPRAIFIDKLFEFPVGRSDAETFIKSVNQLDVPVYIGGAAEDKDSGIPSHPLLIQSQDLKTLSQQVDIDSLSQFQSLRSAHRDIASAFSGVGHINIDEPHELALAYGVQGEHLLPVLPLWGVLPEGVGEDLTIGGAKLHLNSDGKFPVNFLDRDQSLDNVRSLGWVLQEISQGKDLSFIEPGDFVLILPSFFTGGTDFKETIVGKIEGGLILASVLNGFLRGDHLHHEPIGWFLIPFLVLLAAFVAARFPPRRLWPITLLILGLLPSCGFIGFLGFGVQFDWITPSLVFVVAVTSIAAVRQIHDFVSFIMIRKDLAVGQNVQHWILPKSRSVTINGWQVDIQFIPYGSLSGDWFQFWQSSDDDQDLCAVIAIGDVVGKGIGAALTTAVIGSVWHQHAEQWDRGHFSLEGLISSLEMAIHRTFKGTQNSTMSIAVLFKNHAEVLSCGAPPWSHRQEDGQMQRVKARPSNLLGIGKSTTRTLKTNTVSLENGAFLIAYTDGVIDSMKDATRFRKEMQKLKLSGLEKPADAITAVAREIGQTGVQPDDVTMVVIERTKAIDPKAEVLRTGTDL